MGEKITEILPLRCDSPDPRTLFSSVAGEGEVSGMDFAAPHGGFMRSTLKATLLIVIISLSSSVAQAQNAGLTHIFPQVVDGVSSDGTVYTSRFVIATSGGSPATCQVSLFGVGPERLSAGTSILVQGSFFETITSRGEGAIASGYARLDCSQPVVASLTYSILSATGTSRGIATVPSAPNAAAVLIPVVFNGRYRYGIAITNDNDAAQLVPLLFDSGATSLVRTIQLQPRSHYVAFVDEIFNVPAAGLATLRIAAVEGIGSNRFHITALLFDQGSFTNVVPAVIH
jgi:hypothetical protein